MNQQDQSSVGLPIKISHQSTGGADLQVACAKEAEKGLFLFCPPSISPLLPRCHSTLTLQEWGGFFSSFPALLHFLPPCP